MVVVAVAMAAAMAVAARMMKEDEMVVVILVMAVTVVATVVATVAEALAEQAMAAGTQEACGSRRMQLHHCLLRVLLADRHHRQMTRPPSIWWLWGQSK